MSEFLKRCENSAKRFLQTVVIVDDEAYIGEEFPSPGILKTPGRGTSVRTTSEIVESDGRSDHSLDAKTLMDSFSEVGLISAVVTPRSGTALTEIVPPAAKRADIVILDWRLNGDRGELTLKILKEILQKDDEELRLIAVYTGEQNISDIGQTIAEKLSEPNRTFEKDSQGVVLSYRHCRIVIYAKGGLSLAPELKGRAVSESNLPKTLIRDFAKMTEGLLPNIALTSLAAIRENAHKILERFDAKLDPAFLTQRSCLPFPDDSQQHMVSQLANELHAIMDDTAATENPAGMEAIKAWLDWRFGSQSEYIFANDKKLSRDEVVALLESGLQQKPASLGKTKGFRDLTAGFSRGEDTGNQLDHQLARMFNFRTIFNTPSPILQLGTVLKKFDDTYLLCMRPRCDSVRLQEQALFLLVPLVEPTGNTVQLVLCIDKDKEEYRRVSVCMEANRWSLVKFSPDRNKGSVIAHRDDNCFYFTCENKKRFDWLGELKAEFAQLVAQQFASGLSRVAVCNSEWLRRQENIGN